MVIVGVDNSINSPGVVWFVTDDNLNIIRRNYLGFTQKKKDASDKMYYYKKKDFPNGIEQYLSFRDRIYYTILDDVKCKPDYVAFEDYAFAAHGRVFNIAEATGALKVEFYQRGIPLRLYDPGSIKKFASNFGNADKVRMRETYDALNDGKKLDGPVNEDIVDAYFIADLLHKELQLRKATISLRDLTDKQIEVFNRVTKSYPENILVRPFLKREIIHEKNKIK